MFGGFNLLILFRTIIEGIIVILAVYLLSSAVIAPKKVFVWGSVLGITTYFVRMLPINFGVHTIILVLTVIFFSIKMCKIDLVKAIASTLFFIILLFISEWFNILLYENVYHYAPDNLLGDSLFGVILTLPPLFMAIIIVCLITLIRKTKFKKVQ